MVTAISRRVAAEGLLNVKPVLGKGSDPGLPPSTLHAILMVDAYHEIDESRVTLLRNLAKSLRPEGRIGVVDFKLEGGGPGPPTEERVPSGNRREGSGPGRAATAIAGNVPAVSVLSDLRTRTQAHDGSGQTCSASPMTSSDPEWPTRSGARRWQCRPSRSPRRQTDRVPLAGQPHSPTGPP